MRTERSGKAATGGDRTMKRLICLLVCFLLVCSSALAEAAPRRLSADEPLYTSLYERSMELAGLFNEALHSDDYLHFYLTDLSPMEETLGLLRMQDFTQPLDVKIVCAEDILASSLFPFSEIAASLDNDAFSPALSQLARQKLYLGTGSVLLSQQSSPYEVALANMLSLTDTFIRPEELNGPCFAVMHYGGLYAYLVTFYPTANGTVIASARFIPSRAADNLNIPAEQNN